MTTHIHSDKKRAENTLWLVVAIWAVLIAFFALLGLGSLLLRSPAQSSPLGAVGSTVQQTIDTRQEPVQNFPPATEPITIEQSPYTWKLIPRASYQITARVISARQYTSDWMAIVISTNNRLERNN